MRILIPFLIGIFAALVVDSVTDYHFYDWQWWALTLVIIIPLNLAYQFLEHIERFGK